MEITQSKKLYNGTVKARERRKEVVNRLELQLKSGVKTQRVDALTRAILGTTKIPLNEDDTKRISSELLTLKSRL